MSLEGSQSIPQRVQFISKAKREVYPVEQKKPSTAKHYQQRKIIEGLVNGQSINRNSLTLMSTTQSNYQSDYQYLSPHKIIPVVRSPTVQPQVQRNFIPTALPVTVKSPFLTSRKGQTSHLFRKGTNFDNHSQQPKSILSIVTSYQDANQMNNTTSSRSSDFRCYTQMRSRRRLFIN